MSLLLGLAEVLLSGLSLEDVLDQGFFHTWILYTFRWTYSYGPMGDVEMCALLLQVIVVKR